MSRRIFIGFIAMFIILSAAFAGENLSGIYTRAEKGPWGATLAAVKKDLPQPLFENAKIVIVPDALPGERATLNYLFNDSGKLYNMSWYTVMPVAEMTRTTALWEQLLKELGAKYRKPKTSEKQGELSKAREIANASPELKQAREAVAALMTDKPDPQALKAALGGFPMTDVLPMLFYSEQHFWDTRSMYVYAALFCSTDGTSYVHLNFVSKRLAGREPYPAGKRKPFSYTPLDRDQDLVTDTTKFDQGGLRQFLYGRYAF